jgi:hypothetical protein
MSDSVNDTDEFDVEAHRKRLANTIDAIASWRKQMAADYADDRTARRANNRVYHALRQLTRFVYALPADDLDLRNLRFAPVWQREGGWEALHLDDETIAILNRFWINQGASHGQHPQPTEEQMRKVLRRADGAEQRRRSEARQRAEAGYGDD